MKQALLRSPLVVTTRPAEGHDFPEVGARRTVRALTARWRSRLGRLWCVLTIDAGILDAIVAHARRDHPDEACGIVAGPAGMGTPHIGQSVVRLVPARARWSF